MSPGFSKSLKQELLHQFGFYKFPKSYYDVRLPSFSSLFESDWYPPHDIQISTLCTYRGARPTWLKHFLILGAILVARETCAYLQIPKNWHYEAPATS
jgi:hypothetical protein